MVSVVRIGVGVGRLIFLRLGFAYGLNLSYGRFRAGFCDLLSVILSGVDVQFLYLGT